MSQFWYLGRILSDDDNDSHAALRQLYKARKKWNRLVSILRSEGVNPIIMGYFYKAVVQTVLIYGSESWVVSGDIMRKLRSFHHRVARYLTGRHIRKNADGTWTCPPSADVLERAGLLTLDDYIRRRRDTVQEFTRFRPIYELCRTSAATGNRTIWWKLS